MILTICAIVVSVIAISMAVYVFAGLFIDFINTLEN